MDKLKWIAYVIVLIPIGLLALVMLLVSLLCYCIEWVFKRIFAVVQFIYDFGEFAFELIKRLLRRELL